MSKRKGKGDQGDEPTPLLGRLKGHLKMGIVGLPNVGKSTLFNVLTRMGIPAENFPFCTIDPSTSRVHVPDERHDFLVSKFEPKSAVKGFLEVTDIAGLVKGASAGEGLGNAFLSHIAAVDGIFQVVRAFDDAEVTHVEGDVNPVRDLAIIEDELRLKDVQWLEKHIAGVAKLVRAGADPTRKAELEFLERLLTFLQEGNHVRTGTWTGAEIEILNTMPLLTSKPIVYLVNLSERDYIRKKNKWLRKILDFCKERGSTTLIPFSAALETKLVAMEPAEAEAYLKDKGTQSAIPKIIKTGFAALHLIVYFTAGKDEVKAWTIREGYKAPQAAGVIHTDFEKGFIRADVYSFDDFKELGSEQAVRAAGKLRTVGKDYRVEDGDVCFFKTNKRS